MGQKRKKLLILLGERYTFSTGSEHVNIEANWGVKGWVRGSKSLSLELRGKFTGLHVDIDTCVDINWPLLVEREAGGVTSINSHHALGYPNLWVANEEGTISFLALLGQLSLLCQKRDETEEEVCISIHTHTHNVNTHTEHIVRPYKESWASLLVRQK